MQGISNQPSLLGQSNEVGSLLSFCSTRGADLVSCKHPFKASRPRLTAFTTL